MARLGPDARSTVLSRLRAALAATAAPGPDEPPAGDPSPEAPTGFDAAAFGERFTHYLEVGGERYGSFRVVGGVPEAAEAVVEILSARPEATLLAWPDPLVREVADALPCGRTMASSAREAGAALVEADLLCEETGGIAFRSGPGRALGDLLLPPVQIVLAPASRGVSGLDGALARCAEWPAPHVVWICGPSRTADIEKTLVVPAHGPRELHLILLGAGLGR